MVKCVSCNKDVSDYVSFKCPLCGETIVRCQSCRALDIGYNCPKKGCTFKGP